MSAETATRTAPKTENNPLASLAKVLGVTYSWDDVRGTERSCAARLAVLGLAVVCSRCGGSGNHGPDRVDFGRCFRCVGSGKALPRLTGSLLATVRERVESGALQPYLANLQIQKEAREQVAPMIEELENVSARVGREASFWHQRAGLASSAITRIGALAEKARAAEIEGLQARRARKVEDVRRCLERAREALGEMESLTPEQMTEVVCA